MDNQVHHTANSKAIVSAIKFFAAIIIIAAVVYSEILFLGIVSGLFPSGPLAVGAIIGAITTGLSILALCLAKSHWFRPGMQLIVAWAFTLVEIAVLIANDILAYQLHTGAKLDQFTDTWRTFCVAAPALSLVGWILLFYFSPERSISHKRMEMEDNQARAKIDLDSMAHKKAMQFHYRAIDMVGSGMEQQMERLMPYYTEMAARQKLAEIASDLTGRHVSQTELGSAPKSPKIVEADSPKQLAASRDHVVDPHQVGPEVDNEKKDITKKPLIDFSLPKGVSAKMTQKIDTAVATPEEDEEETPEQQTETETDLMALPIDDRWREYTNSQTEEQEQPQKKRGRKKVKQAE